MKRSDFLNAVVAVTATVPLGATPALTGKTVAGIQIPDSQLAKEAAAMATSAEPVEIFNHSLRTYLFAELIAQAKNISHDAELVYVASILHDSGLSPQYMSDAHPFEVDGANVVRMLLTKHGVSEQRTSLAWDAVALHDNGGIAQQKQSEVMLVNAGVGADFGAYLDLMTRSQIVGVLQAAPRANFIPAFINAAAAVATKKPTACAHSFVADIGYRKVPGFHLANFCDEVQPDPFANY